MIQQHSVNKSQSTSTNGYSQGDPRALVPFETYTELQLIAQRIGGDFNMQVEIGVAGEGSFFDTVKCKITLDPLHILKEPGMARFVAGHEGSHRAITLSPYDLGLSEQITQELYNQIGLAIFKTLPKMAR